MTDATLLSLTQRDEAFWLGLALLLGGTLLDRGPPTEFGAVDAVAALGGLLLATRLLVGVGRILANAFRAWRVGYQEGRREEG